MRTELFGMRCHRWLRPHQLLDVHAGNSRWLPCVSSISQLWRVTRNRWLWWRCYSNPASGGLMWSRQRGRKAGSRHHRTPQNHETASERRQKRHFSRAAHATTNRYPEDMHTELRVTLPGPQGSADARRALAVLDRLLNLLGYIEDSVLDKPALRADERSSWGF